VGQQFGTNGQAQSLSGMFRSSKSTRKPMQSPPFSKERGGKTPFGSVADRSGYPDLRSVGSRRRKIHKEPSATTGDRPTALSRQC
jgi:hypothetical protein